MRRETIRQATEAHGWLGLIISVPLFIIFWAGAITLFLPEVVRWSALPYLPVSEVKSNVTMDKVVQGVIDEVDFDDSRRLYVRLPSDYSPYLGLSIPVFKDSEKSQAAQAYKAEIKQRLSSGEPLADIQAQLDRPVSGRGWQTYLIDPNSGEVLSEDDPFELSHFLNELHFTLHLPQGRYLVGLVTFFFLVLVFTGIVIQLKNMIKHFFLYRGEKTTRYKMNDLHNVVGVISLPYGLMYALTGLMFNLGILLQIPTMLVLYQGDRDAMFADAGFSNPTQQASYQPHKVADMEALILRFEQEFDSTTSRLDVQNYGDENSIIRLNGVKNGTFAERISKVYEVKSDSFAAHLNDDNAENRFTKGVNLLFSLHLANFAELDLRVLYFVLAIGVCAMIVAGNVLWIVKRQKKNEYPKAMALTRALTLGGCMGVITATAFAFMMERVLPVATQGRPDIVIWSFTFVLLISSVVAFFKANVKSFVGISCYASGLFISLYLAFDLVVFRETIWTLYQQGHSQPLGVAIAMALTAVLMFYLGNKLQHKSNPEASSELAPAA